MDGQVAAAIAYASRQNYATEPSPVFVHTQSTASRLRRLEAHPEDAAGGSGSTQDRNESFVSMPDQSDDNVDETANLIEPEQDPIAAAIMSCQHHGSRFCEYYIKLWKAFNSDYAIPIWLLLLCLPLSSGIMSSLYMYSCPVSPMLTEFLFNDSLCMMANISLRICLILRKVTTTPHDKCHTTIQSLLICSAILTGFFYSGVALDYWKMTPSPYRWASNFCHPEFQTFLFWWNSFAGVAIVPIILVPM